MTRAQGTGAPRWWRFHPAGLVVGTTFAMLAMTPSLLPRSWFFQGNVSGISAAAGYGVGVVLAWAVRLIPGVSRTLERVPLRPVRLAWGLLLLAIPGSLLIMLLVSAGWQREVDGLVGTPPSPTVVWLGAGPTLLVVALVLVLLTRSIRAACRLTAAALRRWIRVPRRIARPLAVALVALLVLLLVDDVLLRETLAVTDSAFDSANQETDSGVRQPALPTRSGSPESLVDWTTLGREGRSFVAGGPGRRRIQAAVDGPAADPIRVYVGLNSAADPQARADLAVAELQRTGAFDRAVLAVITTTGSGWVNSAAADSLELIYGGDTAVVATQYSYLPSWLSFLIDGARVRESGRLVIDAVSARLDTMPAATRPKLLIYGESLGSTGSEAAFSSLGDLRAQADGVLWVGPPHANPLWRTLTDGREPDSPEIDPVFDDGAVVRFASDATALTDPDPQWTTPRVLYLQHPSDPVVWWSPDLLLQRPDWLVEPRGDDVSPAMSWYPIVTFWQVTADLTVGKSVPDGHGHNYDGELLDGWIAVAAPPGWGPQDTARVHALVRR